MFSQRAPMESRPKAKKTTGGSHRRDCACCVLQRSDVAGFSHIAGILNFASSRKTLEEEQSAQVHIFDHLFILGTKVVETPSKRQHPVPS